MIPTMKILKTVMFAVRVPNFKEGVPLGMRIGSYGILTKLFYQVAINCYDNSLLSSTQMISS